MAAGNGDEDFGKRDEYMVPIEAPCYAVPRGANNIDALVDGLWCDGNFQCLDVDMKPIEGLFAVGNASGPFFGNSNYPMDIEGLSVGRLRPGPLRRRPVDSLTALFSPSL